MPTITAFCLTNLDFGLEEEEFKQEVLRIWGYGFMDANFRLFRKDGNQRKGVVSGFQPTNLSVLQEKSRGEKFKGRNICLKPDTGEPRDDFGKFLQLATPLARRERDKCHGLNYNKLFLAFHPDLLADLGRLTVFRKILTISPMLTDKVLKLFGHYTLFFPSAGVPEGAVCVKYHTILETMQAILSLSGNEKLSQPPTSVSNPFDFNISRTTCGTGLGVGGRILDLAKLNKDSGGFVPFTAFKPTLLDGSILGLSNPGDCIASKCWRCRSSFKLIGMDLDLGFIAGICSCAYFDGILVEKLHQLAYSWDEEPFTRLVLGDIDNNSGQYLNLRISHYPMQKQYISPQHYTEIIFPILEEEWKVYSTNFKNSHVIEATLLQSTHVETIKVKKKGKEKRVAIYALKIRVPSTKLWCLKERSSLKTLYLNLTLVVNNQVRSTAENHKGKVWSVREENEYFCIHAQAHFTPSTKPNVPQVFVMSAKAIKTEYKATRRALRKFAESPGSLSHPYLQLLLNPCSREGWILKELEKEDATIQDFNGLQYLISTLNTAQRLSFDRAIQSSLSIIQGPPGTGKTHNASVLAIQLAINEVGTVIACAPSNEAADNLAEKIATLLKTTNIPLSVLRVESKSRESAQWERCKEAAVNYKPYDVLRELVEMNLDLYPVDNELAPTLKTWMEGRANMLKREDREALETRFKNIEKMLARMYAIQVYTIATLGDGRAKSFSKIRPVTTIIADEIGQATQPSLIMFSQLSPKRIVLTGDHLQLQPHVESQSSADAGLNKSALELASSFYLGGDNEDQLPPWTMLDTQYRMNPSIRKLVSEVTYEGKLMDADHVLFRSAQLPNVLRNRPLVLLNHKSSEVKRGQSYANPGATLVAKYVSELLNQGIKSHLITILSLYEAQKLEIQSALMDVHPDIVFEVLNVDAFQGRENAIIIVSFTRSNLENAAGFTRSPNRLNVAISRAKEMLVIAADMSMFGTVLTKNWKLFCRIINEEAFNY